MTPERLGMLVMFEIPFGFAALSHIIYIIKKEFGENLMRWKYDKL